MFTISVKEFIHVIFLLIVCYFLRWNYANFCYHMLSFAYLFLYTSLFPRTCKFEDSFFLYEGGRDVMTPLTILLYPVISYGDLLTCQARWWIADWECGPTCLPTSRESLFINHLGEKGLEKPVTGRRPAPPRWTQNQYKSLHILEC